MNTDKSFITRFRNLGKTFTLFHTYDASKKSILESISSNKSMDLDISVDGDGNPYLGHSLEFYNISGETKPKDNMLFDEAIELISQANIPIIVDCKDNRAWKLTNEVVSKIGPERCLVHIYATELKFDYNFYDHDYPSEWLAIKNLIELKRKNPTVTTTASCKFLPNDLLVSEKYDDLLFKIRHMLIDSKVDTVCLNVPDDTMTDRSLKFFLDEGIVPHINIDNVNTSSLTEVFIGETNNLSKASNCSELSY